MLGSGQSSAAETSSATPTVMNRPLVPTTFTSSGPSSTSPPSCDAVNVMWNSEFAWSSCPRPATTGSMATSAGAKNWVMVENSTFTANSSHNQSGTRM